MISAHYSSSAREEQREQGRPLRVLVAGVRGSAFGMIASSWSAFRSGRCVLSIMVVGCETRCLSTHTSTGKYFLSPLPFNRDINGRLRLGANRLEGWHVTQCGRPRDAKRRRRKRRPFCRGVATLLSVMC